MRSPRSRIVDGFALHGKSDLPDAATHAYRKDLADIGLAGRVLASHYAEPLARRVLIAGPLRAAPSDEAPVVAQLAAGDILSMLDNSRGWAWGYGPSGAVGYVRSGSVAA